jgi:orotate phosphoribosyltransferase
MKSDEILQIFKDAGAMLDGHFLLTSGLHSPVYWEKFRILQYPHHTTRLCQLIAEHYKDQNVEVVAGPTTGGIILAFEVARQLGIRCIFAEKEDKIRIFRRGLSLEQGDRVLIVDDVFTTGGSIREVIEAVNKLKGNIIGIGVLVDRTQQKIDFGIPLFSCLNVNTVTYNPSECPLCASGIPLVKPGGHI